MAYLSLPYAFPFCIEEITDGSLVGNGTLNPLGFTLNEYFEVYYRYREAEFAYNIDIVEEQPPPDPPILIPFSGTVSNIQLDGVYTNEEGTVIFDGITSEKGFSCLVTSSITLSNSNLNGFDAQISIGTPTYLYSGLYYPGITVILEGAGDEFYSYINTIFTRESTIDVNFFGKTLKVYGQTTQDMTGSMSFLPTLWWGYDPGSGGDVWDTATGTQLRDPFSIQEAG